ncbi:MAG: aldo/keto reductase [Spirochaetia bacterium]|jgi:aryl-alcohol dehydrogenase-like predicted oxidoreductase|nr:aldo/keto reductase [Spirochaetia bacterium]
MKYIKAGWPPIEVSRIILGTWAIGGSNWGGSDEKDAIATIEAAIEAGVTTIDTAPAYGNGRAEELIGRALKGRRNKAVIATKCGLNMEGKKPERDLSPAFIEKDLNNSLRRLQTDYIDIYQCHWPDENTPIEETMAALLKFKEAGKIKYIGVCNFNLSQIRGAARCLQLLSIQPHYSLLERTIEKEEIPFCIPQKISVFAYGTLEGGLLSGKYTEPTVFEKSDARSFFYKFFKKEYWDDITPVLDELRAVSEKTGMKPAQLAVSWVLAMPGITSVIAGARNPEQLHDHVKAVDFILRMAEGMRLHHTSKRVCENLSAK